MSGAVIVSKFLKTHVTALKFVGDYLLAGIGCELHFFSRNSETKCWEQNFIYTVFNGQSIHGILSRGNEILIYGGKSICILQLLRNDKHEVSSVADWTIRDWILDVEWSKDGLILILTANNVLLEIVVKNGLPEETSSQICPETRCILYSGKIVRDIRGNVIILAGTVFSEVVVWSAEVGCVLHRLIGHKGVIFSVAYNENHHCICTTSDDRTVRLWSIDFGAFVGNWSECRITLKYTIFAHSARVWKSHFLNDGRVVSIGEDSLICIWRNGECEQQWSGHQGGKVWSIDSCEDAIATGGSDGAINLWPFVESSQPKILNFITEEHNHLPKNVVNSFNGNTIMVTNKGEIYLRFQNEWKLNFCDSEFSSYSLLTISPDRQCFALGSITGWLLIAQVHESIINKRIKIRVSKGRIYSVMWVSDSAMIVNGPDGELTLYTYSRESAELTKNNDLVLPKCKERWITCCCVKSDYLLCGDRCGSVHLFNISKETKAPLHTLPRIHGFRGVSDVKFYESSIISSGRDGTYRLYFIENDSLVLLNTYKLPFEWPAAVLHSHSLGTVLIGFQEIYLMIWSISEHRPLLRLDCGGGHRSWDCFVEDGKNIIVCYIKDKSVFYYSKPLDSISSGTILSGWNPKPVNSGAVLPFVFDKLSFVILGGEDDTLRLVSFHELNDQNQIYVARRHISSIRTVSWCKHGNDRIYVASAGGRGQLVIWEVVKGSKIGEVKLKELVSHMLRGPLSLCCSKNVEPLDDPEMRYMDLKIFSFTADCLNVIAGCSDGILRLLKMDLGSNQVTLIDSKECTGRCLLQVDQFNFKSQLFAICFETEGKVVFWKLVHNNESENQVNLALDQKQIFGLHCLGINSFDIVVESDYFIVATGCDDSSVALHSFEMNGEDIILQESSWFDRTAHSCQITGLRLLKNRFISTGLDQRLSIFQWDFDGVNFAVTFIQQVTTCIPDTHGLLAWTVDEKLLIYVYGIGVQAFEFKL